MDVTGLNQGYPDVTRGKVIVWGLLAAYPFGGMTWQVLHHLAGLRRLGFDVWYVEDSDAEVLDPLTLWPSAQYEKNVEHLARQMQRIGMGDRWVFRPPGVHDRCLGATGLAGLETLYREADAALNVCGAHRLKPEHSDISCLIYLETDPVPVQVAVAEQDETLIRYLENYDYLFTYAGNIGAEDCRVPLEHFDWRPTRPPVCVDWWEHAGPPPQNAAFTTIARWSHSGNDIIWKGEHWRWSKHYEFQRFTALAGSSVLPLELAVTGISEESAQQLADEGWRLRAAEELSDPGKYRDYIRRSLGEFTAAKEQYVRPRTGWFSDRSVCYLAAGRPVITQETGFSNQLPSGEGLFAFSTLDEAREAVNAVAADYGKHSRAAHAIAREYFDAGVVLGDVMRTAGLL